MIASWGLPNGLSYAVSSFYSSGCAFLDANGMAAAQTAKYSFQRNQPDLRRREPLGPPRPARQGVRLPDNVGTVDLVRSKCGVDRDLNVATPVPLRNNPPCVGTDDASCSRMNNENKKPQPKNDLLEGIRFEPSTESTKNEPTPERALEEKKHQSEK